MLPFLGKGMMSDCVHSCSHFFVSQIFWHIVIVVAWLPFISSSDKVLSTPGDFSWRQEDCLSDCLRIALVITAMAKLNRIWQCNTSAWQASSSSTSLLSPPSSSTAVKHGHCLLILKKRIQAFEIRCTRKLHHISYLEHKTSDWVCGARSSSSWVRRIPFWLLSRDGNLHGLGMSHAMTAPPKYPSRHLGQWLMLWSA